MSTDPELLTVGPAPASTPGPGTSRFAPGAIVAGRYRLVALLGRGGMGEVYRADDLTLDQPVALKFLPASAVGSASLAQLHNELRVARQVSHKNVCRLYDLGDADGRRFLTMEYVDGEDLASLLRRIGRIPEDKAIQIARQLCAGVSAAHERGVLHRDLKPANVMLDGDGQVRITDFGIATAGADADTTAVGTPQYMAPELFGGRPASVKSDIYALGLVLFEIFTGRRAYDGKTLADLRQLHDTGTVATPSSIVRDLDPAIERVILRCLSKDPDQRPATALAVAAALPGGDPLAAALAAGETPSPELLAAAGEVDAIPVAHGLGLIAVLLVFVAVYALVSPVATLAALSPLEKPPAVLADRAQQVLANFGYTDTPADTAENIIEAPDFPRWLVQTDQTTNRWNRSRVAMGPAVLFWYRSSPRDLDPVRSEWTVSPTDPPLTVTGMSLVILDTRGRLLEFHRVPPQLDPPDASTPAVQWEPAFQAAGLEMVSFAPVAPEWTPRDFADTRAAWEGPLVDYPEIRVRVEAAAYRGRVMSFYVVGPWARATRMQPLVQPALNGTLRAAGTVFWIALMIGAVFLARHNLRTNRADHRGAASLATAYVLVQIVAWTIGAHHQSTVVDEGRLFLSMMAEAVLQGGVLWALYLGLEPYGRRFWPDGLVGWTRLFSGRIRDPRIGREILIGSALGGVMLMIDLLRAIGPRLLGMPAGIPRLGETSTLANFGGLFAAWSGQVFGSIQTTLLVAMFVVVVRLAVRRTWLAVVISLTIVTAAAGSGVEPGGNIWIYYTAQIMALGLLTLTIFRFGLLVAVVMMIVDNVPSAVPMIPHAPSWASLPGNLSIALVVGLACFGFYAARAGQPLLGTLDSTK